MFKNYTQEQIISAHPTQLQLISLKKIESKIVIKQEIVFFF